MVWKWIIIRIFYEIHCFLCCRRYWLYPTAFASPPQLTQTYWLTSCHLSWSLFSLCGRYTVSYAYFSSWVRWGGWSQFQRHRLQWDGWQSWYRAWLLRQLSGFESIHLLENKMGDISKGYKKYKKMKKENSVVDSSLYGWVEPESGIIFLVRQFW